MPDKKEINIVPTISQGESAFIERESKQNEMYLNIIKQKQQIIIRRLKELKKIQDDELEADEKATEEIIQRLIAFEQAQNEDASNINNVNNKFNVMNYEYADNESVDSFDSDFKNTNLGNVELKEEDLKGDYLPKLRSRHELSIVPQDIVMTKAQAPNSRLETIASNLTQSLRGTNDEENMFELLYLLGLTKPD